MTQVISQIATDNDMQMMHEASDLKLKIAILEKIVDTIRGQLKGNINDKEFMMDSHGTILITYSTSAQKSLDIDRLKKESP